MNPPPTDLRKLNRALASQNLRAMNFLDGLVSRIDDVVQATFERNFVQVGQISGMIARYSQLRGFAAIAHSANSVRQEAEGSRNDAELRRRVLQLINVCGQARKEQSVAGKATCGDTRNRS